MRIVRVGIILTSNFTLNALANFIDVLRLAADDGDGSRPIRCQWEIMSSTRNVVSASCGVAVTPTARLIDPKRLNYVAVIGGLLHRGRQIDATTRTYLLQARDAGIGLIGICTGSFVLCRLGLMRAKRCCISWYHYRDFLDEFADMIPIADELLVVDGDRITNSGGVGASLLAAFLIERHLGASVAQKALHIMQIDKMRPGATLQPAPPLASACDDQYVTRALLIMEQNINLPLTVPAIAALLHLSTRTLERLFKRHLNIGPLKAYRNLRLRHAQWMLRTKLTLAVVAVETGFASVSHLCAAFRRTYGCAPFETQSPAPELAMPLRSGKDCVPRRAF